MEFFFSGGYEEREKKRKIKLNTKINEGEKKLKAAN